MAISQYQPGANDRYSADYQGSYDEWVARTARSMAERYMRGDQAMLDSFSGATGNIGQPNGQDFGSAKNGGTGFISEQTYDFFASYAAAYGNSDPYIISQYGAPPARRASYGADPNAPGALQASGDRAAAERQAAANASNERIAGVNNATDLQIAGMQTASNEGIAAADRAAQLQIAYLQDATDRYIAEGNWGVQKYVAELQERGAMERLTMELGMREKELAQRAIEEQNRHHEGMIGLALEIAKYDAELAAEPRNWLAYATWLGNRDIVINGLTLAMAADLVPEDMAASEAAGSPEPAAQVAAAQQITVSQQGLVDGTSGGSTGITEQMAAAGQGQQDALGATSPYTVGGIDLQGTDYSAIARQLLGMGPNEATHVPTAQELQGVYDTTSTTGSRVPGYGAWTGPTQTAQGVEVNPMGHQENYQNFTNLLPTQREMRLGAVQGVRGKFGVNDFLAEMERARPKGTVSGSAGLG